MHPQALINTVSQNGSENNFRLLCSTRKNEEKIDFSRRNIHKYSYIFINTVH